jgi:hypothetical protein
MTKKMGRQLQIRTYIENPFPGQLKLENHNKSSDIGYLTLTFKIRIVILNENRFVVTFLPLGFDQDESLT